MLIHSSEVPHKSYNKTLYPIYFLLFLLGLNKTIRPKYPSLYKFYSWAVLLALVFATGRKFRQVGERPNGSRESLLEFFANPNSLITLCNALIMFSGFLAGLLLHKIEEDEFESFNILWEVSSTSRTPEEMRKKYDFNAILAIVSALFSFTMAVFYASSKWGFFVYIVGTSHLISETILCVVLDSYALFISRCAISAVAILFYQHCYVVRRSIKYMINKMTSRIYSIVRRKLSESSLRKIHDCQFLYQRIFNGKTTIEKYYSGALFYAYGVCIPIFCFLAFALMCSRAVLWKEVVSVIIWIINAVLVLLLFSIPAFKIHEDGDKLLTSVFRMYHETFQEDRDLTVLQQVSFFFMQLHSTTLTLSACEYFHMDRSILLSLFSAILTYFLILYKFDIDNKPGPEIEIHNLTALCLKNL